MARLPGLLVAVAVMSAPALASADVEVQKKPAGVTAAQERAMNEKYAKSAEQARQLTEQIERATPKNHQIPSPGKHSSHAVAEAGASADSKPHKMGQHGKVIEVSHHHRRTRSN
jgi:hypothetical protein